MKEEVCTSLKFKLGAHTELKSASPMASRDEVKSFVIWKKPLLLMNPGCFSLEILSHCEETQISLKRLSFGLEIPVRSHEELECVWEKDMIGWKGG